MGLLIVLALALVRHLKLLSASVRTFRHQAQPLLAEIQTGAARAQDRMDRMARRAAERERQRWAPDGASRASLG